MKLRHKVVIDPDQLINVYDRSPGYVDTFDADGKLMKRREATETEALNEQYMQRFEAAVLRMELAAASLSPEILDTESLSG